MAKSRSVLSAVAWGSGIRPPGRERNEPRRAVAAPPCVRDRHPQGMMGSDGNIERDGIGTSSPGANHGQFKLARRVGLQHVWVDAHTVDRSAARRDQPGNRQPHSAALCGFRFPGVVEFIERHETEGILDGPLAECGHADERCAVVVLERRGEHLRRRGRLGINEDYDGDLVGQHAAVGGERHVIHLRCLALRRDDESRGQESLGRVYSREEGPTDVAAQVQHDRSRACALQPGNRIIELARSRSREVADPGVAHRPVLGRQTLRVNGRDRDG